MYCNPQCRERNRPKTEKRLEQKRRAYRAHYQRNKEAILKKNKEWIETHPEKPREYTAAYKRRYPEKVKASGAKHREETRDQRLAYKREYHRNNRDKEKVYAEANRGKLNEYARKWQAEKRAQNPEEHKRKQRDWYHRNPETYRARRQRRKAKRRSAGGSYTAKEWNALLEATGHRCLWCRRTDVKLTPDHVIPVSLGGTSNIDNIQPLCLSCNCRKCNRVMDFRGKIIGS